MKNLSGTITAGGTAQALDAANINRNGYRFFNISDTDMWLNDVGGTAAANTAGSFKVAAGASYVTPPGIDVVGAISVICATTGKAFTASSW